MTETQTDTLTRLAAMLAAGTPGPWYQGEAPMGSCKLDHGEGLLGHGKGECDYRLWDPPRDEPQSVMAGDYVEGAHTGSVVSIAYELREADATKIAAAVTLLPRYVALAEAASVMLSSALGEDDRYKQLAAALDATLSATSDVLGAD